MDTQVEIFCIINDVYNYGSININLARKYILIDKMTKTHNLPLFFLTVFHDFYTAFGKTKIFVQQKNEGYGLKCHRAIKEICQAIGIKDLRAKVEGSTNLQHIVKAFFIGLLQQVQDSIIISS